MAKLNGHSMSTRSKSNGLSAHDRTKTQAHPAVKNREPVVHEMVTRSRTRSSAVHEKPRSRPQVVVDVPRLKDCANTVQSKTRGLVTQDKSQPPPQVMTTVPLLKSRVVIPQAEDPSQQVYSQPPQLLEPAVKTSKPTFHSITTRSITRRLNAPQISNLPGELLTIVLRYHMANVIFTPGTTLLDWARKTRNAMKVCRRWGDIIVYWLCRFNTTGQFKSCVDFMHYGRLDRMRSRFDLLL